MMLVMQVKCQVATTFAGCSVEPQAGAAAGARRHRQPAALLPRRASTGGGRQGFQRSPSRVTAGGGGGIGVAAVKRARKAELGKVHANKLAREVADSVAEVVSSTLQDSFQIRNDGVRVAFLRRVAASVTGLLRGPEAAWTTRAKPATTPPMARPHKAELFGACVTGSLSLRIARRRRRRREHNSSTDLSACR